MTTFTIRTHLPLLLIFVAALVLRLGAVFVVHAPDLVADSESGQVAKNWVDGHGYAFDLYGTRTEQPLQSYVPPLFTALIAFCLTTFGDPNRALGIIQALLSSLIVVVMYFTAERLASSKVIGLLTALMVALYPVFIVMSAYPLSLTMNTFVLSLFLLAVIALQRQPTLPRAIVTGGLFGLALLARPTFIGLLPIALFWIWLLMPNDKQAWLRLLRNGAVVAACAALVLLPWTWRNFAIHGQFVLVSLNGGFNFWNGNNAFTTGSGHEVYTELLDQYLNVPHDLSQSAVVELRPYPMPPAVRARLTSLSEAELDRMLYAAGTQFIREQPSQWLALVATKLTAFWLVRANIGGEYEAAWTRYYLLVYGALLILFAPGLVIALTQWRRYALLYMTLIYFTAAYVAYHVQMRFRWEIEPYLIVFAAVAVAYYARRWPATRRIMERFV